MLQEFANLLVYQWLGLAQGTMLGEALNFFVYDSLKIFLMLSVIVDGVVKVKGKVPTKDEINH